MTAKTPDAEGREPENTEEKMRKVPGDGGDKKRRRGRVLLVLLALYLAVGYASTAFRSLEASDSVEPTITLPMPERALLSGVFSVHTGRSHDARGTRDQVAEAAAEAGLDFVVVGDHPPDDRRPGWERWEPTFMEGVFVGGGVELRAPDRGKVLAMGVDSTFKRWQGSLRGFMGFLQSHAASSMIVHGRGPRESERWDHPIVMGVQGWEVLDISEFARARLRGPWSVYHLGLLLMGYPVGLGDEALVHLMREGFETPTIAAYDSLRLRGPLTATAGLNVHPKLSLGPLLLPSYGPFFRTLVSHLALEEPLPEDPAWAQAALADGIRRGELFISLRAHDAARKFRLRAVLREGIGAPMGADVPAQAGVVLRGGFQDGPGRKVVYRVLRNGREVEWILGPELEWEPPRPGFYRVEVYNYGARLGKVFFRLRPWIFANPIALLGPGDGAGGP